LAGAIDILAVLQPDGSIKTSPFYVRFGKYSGLREKHNRVNCAVNGIKLSLTMQVGRTGEAYFVEEVEEVISDDAEGAENDAVFIGMESPPAGYSDDEAACEQASYTKSQQGDVKRSASEPMLSKLASNISSSRAGEAKERSNVGDIGVGTPRLPAMLPRPPPRALPKAQRSEHLEEQRGTTTAIQQHASELAHEGESPEFAAVDAIGDLAETSENRASLKMEHDEQRLLPGAPHHPSIISHSQESSPTAIPLSEEDSMTTTAATDVCQKRGGGGALGVEPSALSHALKDLVFANSPTAATAPGAGEASSSRSSAVSPAPAPPPSLDLSLCWDVLNPDMSPMDVSATFMQHKVNFEAFQAEDASAILADRRLACRLGRRVYSFPAAQVLIITSLAFGPNAAAASMTSHSESTTTSAAATAAISYEMAASYPQDEGESPPEGSTPRSTDWTRWLTFGWRSKEALDAVLPPQRVQDNSPRSSRSGMKTNRNYAREMSGGLDRRVPPEQEAALLAGAARGQPMADVAVTEVRKVQRTPSGRRAVLLRKRGFVPGTEQLEELASALRLGQNDVEFTFGRHSLRAFIYFVKWDHRLVISDVDGTITKSDVLGHLGHVLGFDWTHGGVTALFAAVAANGYGLLYLSSRSIAQASVTRDYLHSLKQDGASMPYGPVIISPDGLFPSLYREVVLRRPQEFKIRCLEDIRSLFPPECDPFVAGFGNRDTDVESYLAVGVPVSRIFIINPKGELRKPSSAVITSSLRSLPALTDLVDSLFPAVPHTEYSSEFDIIGGRNVGNRESRSSPNAVSIPYTQAHIHPSEAGDTAVAPTEAPTPESPFEGLVASSRGAVGRSPRKFAREDTTHVRDEFNSFNYWRVQPSYVVDDEEDLFEDAESGSTGQG